MIYKIWGNFMLNQNDDLDKEETDGEDTAKVNRKKILFFLIPGLTAIGLAVGLYYTFTHDYDKNLNYSLVTDEIGEDGKAKSLTVFYDIPEIVANLKKSDNKNSRVKIKINLELSDVAEISRIDALIPRINDAVLSHTIELSEDEVSGASGLYWLKEELLYRINLLIAPATVKNLNFKNFEIQTKEN